MRNALVFSSSFILLLFPFIISPSFAEVDRVVVKWTADTCPNFCQERLKSRFAAINNVAEMQLDPRNGTATFRWKPNDKFSYEAIKREMRMVGIGMVDLRVSVRGTVSYSPGSDTYTLISLGDNTHFNLYSPVQSKPNQQVLQYTTATRTLSPEVKSKLAAAQQTDRLVFIEGFLLEPERSPPLQLVVERIQLPKLLSENRE